MHDVLTDSTVNEVRQAIHAISGINFLITYCFLMIYAWTNIMQNGSVLPPGRPAEEEPNYKDEEKGKLGDVL